ncbi:hypothetical protein ONS96_009691 [Cadophora gregata f. sp. sojae]|nr:hypothetical protein ONS96_009691 [Cadophora gregata f. sp. sojae]
MALATRTVQLLQQSSKKLKSLHVEYPEAIEESLLGFALADEEDQDDNESQEARRLFRVQDFSAFANLEEVTFNNIYDDLFEWRRMLVKILKSSPRLRKLGLSISNETIARAYHHDNSESYIDFFDNLCDEYGASGAPPLQLQILRCGYAMYPQNVASFQKLTDLSHLEVVHVENACLQREMVYLFLYKEDENSGIVFDTFLSPACCNLRRFTAYQLRGDVFKALCHNTDANWMRQLAISFENPEAGDYEMAQILTPHREYSGLPLQVRMMDLDLKGSDEDETLDILDNLVSANSENLEGLAVHLPRHPTRNDSFGHMDLLQDVAQKLPNLTQIVINLQSTSPGRDNIPDQLHKIEAEKMANAVPQLQFICICRNFWRICRRLNGEGKMLVILESLDEWEREDVELFQHTIFKVW